MTLSILIVEDVDEMRALLEMVIAKVPGLKVSGSARNGPEARLEIMRRRPDVVLLDEVLPGESGLDLLRDFTDEGIAVILISGTVEARTAPHPKASGRLAKPTWDTLEADAVRMRQYISKALKAQKS